MDQNFYDAVIIGAGVSGLRAAQRMTEAGGRVLVLEAASIPGGRIKGGLGAMWDHGRGESVLMPVFDAYGLDYTLDPAEKVSSRYHGQTYGTELRAGMAQAMGDALALAQASDPNADVSIDQGISDPMYREMAHYFRCVWFSARDGNISLRDALSDSFEPGGHVLKAGLPAFIDRMMASLAPENFRFSTPVDAVTNRDGIYSVHTASGDQITARAVIYTGSVGAFQSGYTDLTEVLSADMQRLTSRKNIAMGNMDKGIFTLPTEFLSERPEMVNHHLDYVDQRIFEHTGIGGKPVINYLFGGEDADRIEAMTKNAVQREIIDAVRKEGMHPDLLPILEGQAMDLTGWGKEEFIRGAYSYIIAGGERVAVPLENGNFRIAGEAFSPFAGHISGAWLSGEMAGDQTVAALKLTPAMRNGPQQGLGLQGRPFV